MSLATSGFILLGLACAGLAVAKDNAPPKLALIGDSTVCKYPESGLMRGWGHMLPEFLADGVGVMNEARGGLSTKTFPRDRWQAILSARPDYVLIQFGHNDSHARGLPESTDAKTDYKDNLRRFLSEARAAGVEPVLVTPPRRRLFLPNGTLTNELAPYAEAMKDVARETTTRLIDLHELSRRRYAELGEAGSAAFTVNKVDQADRPGQDDRTHFTVTGAREMAALVAGELTVIDPSLTRR